MKETAIAEMLNNCSIEDAKIIINVCDQNGEVHKVTLQDPEDLINEVLPSGEVVNLVFSNWKIYTGIFDSVEDEDGQLVIYIRAVNAKDHLYGLPFDRLVGYYQKNRS